jgi:hypothetical protein
MTTRVTILSLSFLLLTSSLLASDLRVPQDFPTIQDAIGAASDGDRVLVAPGNYAERIDFLGKDIVLESTDGPDVTVIDGVGEEAGHVVTFAGGETRGAVLRGFTVTGGVGSAGSFGLGEGGGILIDGAAPLIDGCFVVGNTGIDGGGLESRNGDPRIVASRFADNSATSGGGVYAEGGAITIESSEFTGNSAGRGGGVAIWWQTDAEVHESIFTANVGREFGSGLFATHATLNASWLEFRDNGEATFGDDGVSITFTSLAGGGLYVRDTVGRLDVARFVGNRAAFGGGAYIAGDGEFELINALIAENLNGTGAIYANASSPRIVNCTIVESDVLAIYTTFFADPVIKNSIIAGGGTIGGNGEPTLDFSLLSGSAGVAIVGEGNIFAAPDLDPAADYAPRPGSPAIDAGDTLAIPAGVTTDLVGNARFFDDPGTPDSGNGTAPIVDMGALEFGSSAADNDGVTAARDVPASLLSPVQAVPNPFNPRVEVRFALERATEVRVAIHDARGRRVADLQPGTLPAGSHALRWDGTDTEGRPLATGVYLAVVSAGDQRQTTKMTLVR